jgi:hypothetical protein
MNALISWALAAAALYVGWHTQGMQGLLVGITVIVFWLLLQFNRAIRVMKAAGQRPIGHVPSAVMLNAKLHAGMTMLQIVKMTRSLGQQTGVAPETWEWADNGGSRVTLEFAGGKLKAWTLDRPDGTEEAVPTP